MTTCLENRFQALSVSEADLVVESLGWLHRMGRARIHAYVVMPDHVHLVIQCQAPHNIRTVMKSWKQFSGLRINRLRGSEGRLWQESFHDRVIRDEAGLQVAVDYVRLNPIRAGLVTKPEDYPHSSARHTLVVDVGGVSNADRSG
ncbi:MAG: transposase [Deltaproteobacteria bacterium]|nr:transposase [Deltaproteobacteria bacterium]